MRAKLMTDTELAQVLSVSDDQEAVMVLLTHRIGLRAHEVAGADFAMCVSASGALARVFDLPAMNSKGRCGAGRMPIADDLFVMLDRVWKRRGSPTAGRIVLGARDLPMSAHAVQQRLVRLYAKAGLVGCTSHSGRRTFANKLRSKIELPDLQLAMRHARISTTLDYLDAQGAPAINAAILNLSA